jgi:DNA polymerase-3 subunit beta
MKVFILRDNLKEALRLVERIATKNINLPILENALLSAEKNFLILTSTDLETAVRCWTLAQVENKGNLAVPVKFLATYINSLAIEKLSLKSEGPFLFIENKTFKTQIKLANAEDFPPLPSFDQEYSFSLNISPFIEGLQQVVEIAAFSQSKPEISGVFFSFQPDLLKLVATDSFRLGEKTLFFEKRAEKSLSFILPQKAVRELINVFADKKGKLILYFSKNHIVFEFTADELAQPKIQVFSRLIEGEFPNYQEIIPQKYQTQISLARLSFLHQIKTAGLFSGKISEVKIGIKPKQQTIEIFSQNPELGENKATLPAKTKGEGIEVSFNWRFLIEGLANIKSPEVTFELSGEEGPAVLKPVGDESYFYIVMPIKAS